MRTDKDFLPRALAFEIGHRDSDCVKSHSDSNLFQQRLCSTLANSAPTSEPFAVVFASEEKFGFCLEFIRLQNTNLEAKEKMIKVLEEKNAELENSVMRANLQNQKAAKITDELRGKVDQQESSVMRANLQIHQADKMIDELRGKIAQQEKSMIRLNLEKRQYLESMDEKLAAKNETIKDLGEKLAQVTSAMIVNLSKLHAGSVDKETNKNLPASHCDHKLKNRSENDNQQELVAVLAVNHILEDTTNIC